MSIFHTISARVQGLATAGAAAVRDTPELARIRHLPRRDPTKGLNELVTTLTNAFRRPGGSQTLRPLQALAVLEMHQCRGGFYPISAGGGKTLVFRLAPFVLQARRAVLFVPKKLTEETERHHAALDEHWIGPRPRVLAYQFLGHKKQGVIFDDDRNIAQQDLLTRYEPDAVLLDEAHKVKSPDAVVRLVLGDYHDTHPTVPFVAATGTPAKLGIVDYAHVLKWCLGARGCPLPVYDRDLAEWAAALDDKVPERVRAGALLQLCDEEELIIAARGLADELDAVRSGFRRRLVETPGVVASLDEEIPIPLTLEALDPGKGCAIVEGTFAKLRGLHLTPSDDPVPDGKTEWAVARQLALGLHYRWDPPPPDAWRELRKECFAWTRQAVARNQLKIRSYGQLKNAVLAGRVDDGGLLRAWLEMEPTFTPNPVPVWHSDEAVNAAAAWLHSHERGVVWTEHTHFAKRLADVSGLPYFGENGVDKNGRFILDYQGPCIASRPANGEGRNMQWWNTGLFMTIPQEPIAMEQTLARMHRPGQHAKIVRNFVWIGCYELVAGVDMALVGADANAKREGGAQRVLYATRTLPTVAEVMKRGGSRWVK